VTRVFKKLSETSQDDDAGSNHKRLGEATPRRRGPKPLRQGGQGTREAAMSAEIALRFGL
jgi:hypothetical protein